MATAFLHRAADQRKRDGARLVELALLEIDLRAGQQRVGIPRLQLEHAREAPQRLRVAVQAEQHPAAAPPQVGVVRRRGIGGIELGDALVDGAEAHQRFATQGARVWIAGIGGERDVRAAHRTGRVAQLQAQVGAQRVRGDVGVPGADGALDHGTRGQHVTRRRERLRLEQQALLFQAGAPAERLELDDRRFVAAEGEQAAPEVFDERGVAGGGLRGAVKAGEGGVELLLL